MAEEPEDIRKPMWRNRLIKLAQGRPKSRTFMCALMNLPDP